MVSLTAPVPRPGAPSLLEASNKPLPLHTPPKKRTGSQAGLDADIPGAITNQLQPSSKKAKVHFELDVEKQTQQDDSSSIDFLREQVSRALGRHKNLGDSKEYSEYIQIFSEKVSSQPLSKRPSRRHTLQALTRIPTLLDNSVTDLVSAVLNSDWIVQDAAYFNSFSRFITCLVSARSSWTSVVLEMLVAKFSKPLPRPATDLISRKEAEQRFHQIITQVIDIAPLDGTVSLKRALIKLFPGSWDTSKTHILYVHNLLKVISYVPQLEYEILALITDRVVKIDVQVQTDTEDIEDLDDFLFGDSPEALDTFVDSLEDEEDEGMDDDSELTEGTNLEEKATIVKKEIQKMDLLLDILFEHYTTSTDASGAIRNRFYELLESQFDKIVLPTYRSRHTQFLIFHFAQSSVEYIDRFVGDCLMRVMDRGRPALVRHSAAAYLASFVARGARVPAKIVRDVFTYTGDTLAEMRNEYEPKCDGRPDLRRFGVYYSLVQALLYIFCFRWRDLEGTFSDPGSSPEPYNSATVIHPHETNRQQDHAFVPNVRETLIDNIKSSLNPLKICAPVIAEEFARVAKKTGLTNVYSKLEDNKRIRLVQTNLSILGRESALSARRDQEMLQLDEFFPFDPYNLPRSKRWLVDDYRAWQDLPEADDAESNSEDESGDDDEDEILSDDE